MLRTISAILAILLAFALFQTWSGDGSGTDESALSPGDAQSARKSDSVPALPSVAAASLERVSELASPRPAKAPRQGEVTGRCIEHLTGLPIAEVPLRFLRAEVELGRTRSDDLGAFTIQITGEEFDRIELPLGEPWWIVEHEESGPEHVVRLAPHDIGLFRGRLLDETTGEPVPEYVIELEDALGWKETLQSDDDGLITSTVLFTRGALTFRGHAEELSQEYRAPILARHEHMPRGLTPAIVAIRIELGPTYHLHLENPGGIALTNLRAYLAPTLWMEEVIGDRAEAFSIHDGEPLWVRFSRDVSWVEDPHLIIADTGGRWVGHAPVELGAGVHEDPVHIRLERRLRLRGRVFDNDDEPVARVQIELLPTEISGEGISRNTESNGMGNFLIENVPPGTYEVFSRHHRKGMARTRIEVSEDNSKPLSIRLEEFDFAGDVAGTIRSLTGEFHDALTVQLKPLGETSKEVPRRQIRVHWEKRSGAWEGQFRFEGVPRGDYELMSVLLRGDYVIEPKQKRLVPPDEFIEILVRDDVPRYRLGVVVMDGDSGRWLDEAQLRIVDDAGLVAYEGKATRWGPARQFAEGEEFAWKVHHPGYVSQHGNRADFDRQTVGQAHYAIIRLLKD